MEPREQSATATSVDPHKGYPYLQLPTPQRMNHLLSKYIDHTGNDALSKRICGCCGQRDFVSEFHSNPFSEICTASDYAVNPANMYKIFSARLSWLCKAWFGDCTGFMEMLYRSGALISGSAALKLVSGKLFRPSDIDFVVTAAHANIVFAFLISKGYRDNFRSATYLGYYAPASFVVRRFARGDRSVDVTVAPAPSNAFDIITRYHSSVVMNAVGWEGIIVLCPEFTFNNLVLRRLRHGGLARQKECLLKYKEQGWRELYWQGHPVYMEDVEGLLSRTCCLRDGRHFTPILWSLL